MPILEYTFEPVSTELPEGTFLIIVKRIINDNGGTATVEDFGITTTAGTLVWDEGVPDGPNTLKYTATALAVLPGTWSLHEEHVTGYTDGTWSVTGNAGAFSTNGLDGAITIQEGETVTATITNDDRAATLQLIKRITNNVGTATVEDFGVTTTAGALTFDAGTPDGDNTLRYESEVLENLAAGTYTLHEDVVENYNAGTWVCSGAIGTVVGDPQSGSVQIALGEDVICTITNADTEVPCVNEIVLDASYEDGTLVEAQALFNSEWGGGSYGVVLPASSGVMSDPAPVGSRIIAHFAIAGGSAQYGGGLPYGRQPALHSRVITTDEDSNPLDPNTNYVVRFWMNMGWLQSSEIGSHPGAHTVSVGMMADGGEQVINTLWVWYAAGNPYYFPSGSEDPSIPLKNNLFIYPANSSQMARELFAELDGWKEYSFVAQTNGSGELGLTFGRFDTANYAGGSGFDGIRVTTFCEGDVDHGDVEPAEHITKINVTQMAVESLVSLPQASMRVTQAGIEHIRGVPAGEAEINVTQMGIEYLQER